MKYGMLFIILVNLYSSVANAQLRGTRIDRSLALEMARVAMNESGGNEADLAMIWQIVRNHGNNSFERRTWLRAHSPCATGRLSQQEANNRPGNCRWTRNLMPAQDRMPEGFPSRTIWRNRTRERWNQILLLSLSFILGERELIVCPENPVTWDGPAWRDQAERRGFIALDCKGTRNVGYIRRRD